MSRGTLPDSKELLKSAVRNGENYVLHCFSSHAGTGSRQHCLPGASAIRRVTSSLVTLSNDDSMLDSKICNGFVADGCISSEVGR